MITSSLTVDPINVETQRRFKVVKHSRQKEPENNDENTKQLRLVSAKY